MKKVLALLLVLGMMLFSFFALAGCQKAEDKGYEIAMITDKGTIDDKSFNQGTWEGVKAYAEANDITYQYYKPAEVSDAAYLDAIKLAIDGGAKVVVCPGYLFEVAIYDAQTLYPDTTFILIDGAPHTADYATYETKSNVLSIFFAEEQAGFFSGYAAVKDGFTKLGFQGGMAVPAVVRYGYGFLQGAETAAKEMGLAEGSIEVKYNYSGDFAATPENQARAAGWYQAGTEIIFACGGSVGNSVMAAAEGAGGKFVIGVDVDQYAESTTVVSSALKQLGNAVQQALATYYDGTFEGGVSWNLDVTKDGVGLAMANAQWRTFTEADYETVLAGVKDGTYTINNTSDTETPIAELLGLKYVTLTEVVD